jgi:ribosomal protein S18 acetylase RimI-like enzyme
MSKIVDSEIIIRRMMRSDIDPILVLDEKIGQGQSKVSYRDLVVTDPGGPLDFSFVCEYKGIIIGFILARLAYMGLPLIATCVMGAIAVDPDYQEQGIGSKMVNKVLDRCYNEDVPRARALIDEEDIDLARFFQRLSFQRSKFANYDHLAIADYLPSK